MTSDTPIRDIAEAAGWTDQTLISLLIAFLAEQGTAMEDAAAAYLEGCAKEDRDAAGPSDAEMEGYTEQAAAIRERARKDARDMEAR